MKSHLRIHFWIPLTLILTLATGLANAGQAIGAGPGSGHGGGGGHGGGAGHGGGGHPGGGAHGFGGAGPYHGGPGPGFRGGCYGYPLGYGAFGLGLGYGLGYGYGYGYGYPYYAYPVLGDPVYIDPADLPDEYPLPVASPPRIRQGPRLVRVAETDALLSVRVPAVDAVISINGAKTNQSGPRREFMSSGLIPGRSYSYEIRAQWIDGDGKAVDANRHLSVHAGERRTIDFALPPFDAK